MAETFRKNYHIRIVDENENFFLPNYVYEFIYMYNNTSPLS